MDPCRPNSTILPKGKIHPSLWGTPLLTLSLFSLYPLTSAGTPWAIITCASITLALGVLPLLPFLTPIPKPFSPNPPTPNQPNKKIAQLSKILLLCTLIHFLGQCSQKYPTPLEWAHQMQRELQSAPYNDIGQTALYATLCFHSGGNPYTENIQGDLAFSTTQTPVVWRPDLPQTLRGFHYGPGMLIALYPLKATQNDSPITPKEILTIQTLAKLNIFPTKDKLEKIEQMLWPTPKTPESILSRDPTQEKLIAKVQKLHLTYRLTILTWSLGIPLFGILLLSRLNPNIEIKTASLYLLAVLCATSTFPKEYWLQAICDPINLTLLLAGLWAYLDKKPLAGGLLLGLSLATKLGPALFAIIPLLHRKSPKTLFAGLALGALLPCLPFLIETPEEFLRNSLLATTEIPPKYSLTSLLPETLQKNPTLLLGAILLGTILWNNINPPSTLKSFHQTLLLTAVGVVLHKEFHTNHLLWVVLLTYLASATHIQNPPESQPKTTLKPH